jgi:hypothetical protein
VEAIVAKAIPMTPNPPVKLSHLLVAKHTVWRCVGPSYNEALVEAVAELLAEGRCVCLERVGTAVTVRSWDGKPAKVEP